MTTFEKVREIITDQLSYFWNNAGQEVDVKPDSNIINELGADSLDFVEIIMAVEEEFDTEIPDIVCEKIKTIKDIVDYVEKECFR